VGFSQHAYDHLRCSIWTSLELHTRGPRGPHSRGPKSILNVLLIKRKGKRSWGNDLGMKQIIESSSLPTTWGGKTEIVVASVHLEDMTPVQQCVAFFNSHIIIAMHGSALGNSFCAAPGSVLIEVFPPGFHLDMFGLLAAASGVYNLNLLPDPCAYPSSTKTAMSRGFKLHMYPAMFNSSARNVGAFQPSRGGLERALKAASLLLKFEESAGWSALEETFSACL
jgi:hypothetical protein